MNLHFANNTFCHPESAIVLDLLMSLPEELPLLDCNKLHKHMIQVRPAAYTQPSSSCDQALKALKLFFLLRIKLL